MAFAKPTIMTAVPRFYQNLFTKISMNFEKQKGIKKKLINQTLYFGKKILYEESPQSLPKEEYKLVHKEIASRILSTNEEKWNTIPRTYSEIDTLRNKFKDDKEKLKALQDINSYVEEIEQLYQKAS